MVKKSYLIIFSLVLASVLIFVWEDKNEAWGQGSSCSRIISETRILYHPKFTINVNSTIPTSSPDGTIWLAPGFYLNINNIDIKIENPNYYYPSNPNSHDNSGGSWGFWNLATFTDIFSKTIQNITCRFGLKESNIPFEITHSYDGYFQDYISFLINSMTTSSTTTKPIILGIPLEVEGSISALNDLACYASGTYSYRDNNACVDYTYTIEKSTASNHAGLLLNNFNFINIERFKKSYPVLPKFYLANSQTLLVEWEYYYNNAIIEPQKLKKLEFINVFGGSSGGGGGGGNEMYFNIPPQDISKNKFSKEQNINKNQQLSYSRFNLISSISNFLKNLISFKFLKQILAITDYSSVSVIQDNIFGDYNFDFNIVLMDEDNEKILTGTRVPFNTSSAILNYDFYKDLCEGEQQEKEYSLNFDLDASNLKINFILSCNDLTEARVAEMQCGDVKYNVKPDPSRSRDTFITPYETFAKICFDNDGDIGSTLLISLASSTNFTSNYFTSTGFLMAYAEYLNKQLPAPLHAINLSGWKTKALNSDNLNQDIFFENIQITKREANLTFPVATVFSFPNLCYLDVNGCEGKIKNGTYTLNFEGYALKENLKKLISDPSKNKSASTKIDIAYYPPPPLINLGVGLSSSNLINKIYNLDKLRQQKEIILSEKDDYYILAVTTTQSLPFFKDFGYSHVTTSPFYALNDEDTCSVELWRDGTIIHGDLLDAIASSVKEGIEKNIKLKQLIANWRSLFGGSRPPNLNQFFNIQQIDQFIKSIQIQKNLQFSIPNIDINEIKNAIKKVGFLKYLLTPQVSSSKVVIVGEEISIQNIQNIFGSSTCANNYCFTKNIFKDLIQSIDPLNFKRGTTQLRFICRQDYDDDKDINEHKTEGVDMIIENITFKLTGASGVFIPVEGLTFKDKLDLKVKVEINDATTTQDIFLNISSTIPFTANVSSTVNNFVTTTATDTKATLNIGKATTRGYYFNEFKIELTSTSTATGTVELWVEYTNKNGTATTLKLPEQIRQPSTGGGTGGGGGGGTGGGQGNQPPQNPPSTIEKKFKAQVELYDISNEPISLYISSTVPLTSIIVSSTKFYSSARNTSSASFDLGKPDYSRVDRSYNYFNNFDIILSSTSSDFDLNNINVWVKYTDKDGNITNTTIPLMRAQ